MSESNPTRYMILPDTMDLLVARYRHQEFALHFHETYTFGVVESGECRFLRSNVPYIARSGDLFIVHPFELHTGSAAAGGLQYRVIYPTADWIRTILPRSCNGQVPYFPEAVYRVPEAEDLRLSIRAIAEYPGRGNTDLTAVGRCLTAVMEGYSQEPRSFPDSIALDARIGAACELLRNADEEGSYGELAARFGLNRHYFHRLFRRKVGLTPSAWSRTVRLSQAKHMIQAGQSLADTAIEARFSDQSHLTREFKRVYGVTPGQLQTIS
jgi:AraC-like DNA-binding protein